MDTIILHYPFFSLCYSILYVLDRSLNVLTLHQFSMNDDTAKKTAFSRLPCDIDLTYCRVVFLDFQNSSIFKILRFSNFCRVVGVVFLLHYS